MEERSAFACEDEASPRRVTASYEIRMKISGKEFARLDVPRRRVSSLRTGSMIQSERATYDYL